MPSPSSARGDVRRLFQLHIGLCAGGGHVDGARAVEDVADRADRQPVVARLEASLREGEAPLRVAHHGGRHRRTWLLGGDEHAFHRAFLGGGHLTGERRGLCEGR